MSQNFIVSYKKYFRVITHMKILCYDQTLQVFYLYLPNSTPNFIVIKRYGPEFRLITQ